MYRLTCCRQPTSKGPKPTFRRALKNPAALATFWADANSNPNSIDQWKMKCHLSFSEVRHRHWARNRYLEHPKRSTRTSSKANTCMDRYSRLLHLSTIGTCFNELPSFVLWRRLRVQIPVNKLRRFLLGFGVLELAWGVVCSTLRYKPFMNFSKHSSSHVALFSFG